jgi:hypothetical protein
LERRKIFLVDDKDLQSHILFILPLWRSSKSCYDLLLCSFLCIFSVVNFFLLPYVHSFLPQGQQEDEFSVFVGVEVDSLA